MIKVLNLYAGVGGNRLKWEGVDVTAVERNPQIATIYQDFFPKDKVIVADAHQYLLDHYDDGWDFIWSSPPCPSHSYIRLCGVQSGQTKAVYPDMNLYQEIIFLHWHCKCKWLVENVHGYYEPLIKSQEIGRHRFWSNFSILKFITSSAAIGSNDSVPKLSEYHGVDLSKYKIKKKLQVLRNCVNPRLGLHILNSAFKLKQATLKV